MLLPALCFSQTTEERKKIASQSDKVGNTILLTELRKQENERKIRLENYLKSNPEISKVKKFDEIGTKELMDVLPNGELIFAKTDNAGAAITARATSLYNGGSLGLNIQGQGMIGGIWDGGSVRSTHQEFMVGGISKVLLMDGASMANHATHVGGTIAAQGVNSLVKGLAFNASLNSYDWTNDLAEMLSEASGGLLVSNHSYGIGSLSSLWFYGAYDSRARQMDQICFNNPFYLPVVSAGNDRNANEAPGSTQIANKGGYDMIFGHGNAKNVITVAAVQNVASYTGPASVIMSTFSSYGPSDDGRIKPEISMKGVNVRSTLYDSDTSVGFMSGTSMASPGVTGVVLLLQQYYNQLYSNYMKAATAKGLILHTADEAGFYDGPDYEFGWGLINAENAAKVIRDKNLISNRSIIEENTLNNGSTFTKNILSNGLEPLKISISWTDPQYPGQNSGTVDPTTKYLVNDLDIKVTSASGAVYYPWKLQGMGAPYDPPTNNSTNDVDNFERVDIPLPAGSYTISVTHKGTLTNGTQNFTLIASGGNFSTLSTADQIAKSDKLDIYPNPAGDWVYFKNNNDLEASVVILDMSGKLLKKETIKNGKISVKELVKGNYMLLYSDKNKEQSFKFIKL
ncbi:S8 family serine peptidase [Chryseobacterium sp. YIM B08800]|uniref:S8 family serine peptidase n=1 Tax=Chryseobacterium sp. YIM B08800 TaxID=2984136 RepID=UPI00223F966D|nr:S8 family serine peptidase [Chryseobacterium sp. YIM B08800]